MVIGICYGPNQWCPGDSLFHLTQNHIVDPVTWDMTVCHTYYHVAPDQADQGQGIYDGPNPLRPWLLPLDIQVGLPCHPRSSAPTSAYRGAPNAPRHRPGRRCVGTGLVFGPDDLHAAGSTGRRRPDHAIAGQHAVHATLIRLTVTRCVQRHLWQRRRSAWPGWTLLSAATPSRQPSPTGWPSIPRPTSRRPASRGTSPGPR
jgi:hypothetical protein